MTTTEFSTANVANSPKKRWAREHLRGIEGTLRASFSPDFSGLDEDGIRFDVQRSIAHGYFAIQCSAPGLTIAENKRYLSVAADEAAGRIQLCTVVNDMEFEEAADLLTHAEAVGATHAMIKAKDRPGQTEDELYQEYVRLLDVTNLGAVLYAYSSLKFANMHPTGIPLPVLRRVAALPNAVGVKLTQTLNPAAVLECCEFLADRILINSADMSIVPLIAKTFPIQWMGQFNIEALQSPEAPYAVRFMDEIQAGRIDAALELYWKMHPAFEAFSELQRSFLLRGSHPWTHLKYYQWCVGGNGGLYRIVDDDAGAVLDAAGRHKIKDLYARIGVPIVDAPEDEFIVGKSNYAKGIRPADLSGLPCYTK